MKPKAHIIGGGFSGLVVARALVKRGFEVFVHEKSDRFGGLIQSPQDVLGIYETAANGMLNGEGVEELFRDAGVAMTPVPHHGRRRFIARAKRLRRWPLGPFETLCLIGRWLWSRLRGQHVPGPYETLRDWCQRVLTKATFAHLLAPALQGIYAGEAEKLSATLLLKRLLTEKRKKVHPRGTVFPAQGMERLIEGLVGFLELHGVVLNKNVDGAKVLAQAGGQLVVIATSAAQAAELLESSDPQNAALLKQIEMLPLLSVQVFAAPGDIVMEGFGALFARDGWVRALGVMGDQTLFPERSRGPSERWILGGATDPTVALLNDHDLKNVVMNDRLRLGGRSDIQGIKITRWAQALPHYTVELERILEQLKPKTGVRLIGNYLGRIGLTQILQLAENLAEEERIRLGAKKSG